MRATYGWAFPPHLGLTRAKRSKLWRSAHKWVAAHDYQGSFRIDLLCVIGGKVIEHITEIEER